MARREALSIPAESQFGPLIFEEPEEEFKEKDQTAPTSDQGINVLQAQDFLMSSPIPMYEPRVIEAETESEKEKSKPSCCPSQIEEVSESREEEQLASLSSIGHLQKEDCNGVNIDAWLSE